MIKNKLTYHVSDLTLVCVMNDMAVSPVWNQVNKLTASAVPNSQATKWRVPTPHQYDYDYDDVVHTGTAPDALEDIDWGDAWTGPLQSSAGLWKTA